MGLDFGILGVLENFRGRIQQRLADLPAATRLTPSRPGPRWPEPRVKRPPKFHPPAALQKDASPEGPPRLTP